MLQICHVLYSCDGSDGNPVPRSPLRVRGENVILCLHYRMAREPAICAATNGLERIGRGVIVKLGVSPVAALWKSLTIPDHEIDVMQGAWHF